jgi:hypothetical protein
MRTRKTRAGDLPTGLERLRRRFERWRQSRKPRSHIPDSLWAAAAATAKTYGVNRTARTLRLDYYSLKERVEQEAAATPDASAIPATAPFIELVTSPSAGPCQCRLELENAGGAKMRIQLRSVAMPDLAAISRSFWNSEP